MIRHSIRLVIRATFLLIIIVLASCAPPPTIAQSPCGAWQVAVNPQDPRVNANLIRPGSGANCDGAFRLSNDTGLPLLGGGYTLELQVHSVQEASYKWDPAIVAHGNQNSMADLLPDLDIELQALPNAGVPSARISVRGDMSLRSWTVDTSLFLLRTALALDPFGISCAIPQEQLMFVAIRTSTIVAVTANLAGSGDAIGARQEFMQVADVFYAMAGKALQEIGVGCAVERLAKLAGVPVVIPKVALALLTWAPVAIHDYFKFQGQPVQLGFEFTAAIAPVTSIPIVQPPSTIQRPTTAPPTAPPASTNYTLSPKRWPSLCLGVRSQDAFIEQRGCSGALTQSWEFQPMGGGNYQLVARSNGRCMTVQDGSRADWALIIQATCTGAEYQQWGLRQVGAYYQIVAKHSGQCIDEDAFSGKEGLEMQQGPCGTADIDNQLWQRK